MCFYLADYSSYYNNQREKEEGRGAPLSFFKVCFAMVMFLGSGGCSKEEKGGRRRRRKKRRRRRRMRGRKKRKKRGGSWWQL
jgi:hypothetical protein